MEPEDHVRQAFHLLDISDRTLIAANGQLKSEVLWGVATQLVKAAGKQQNLTNSNHREMFRAVRELARRTDDPDLMPQFGDIEKLHVNFYDGEMADNDIAERREVLSRFVAKMQRILND